MRLGRRPSRVKLEAQREQLAWRGLTIERGATMPHVISSDGTSIGYDWLSTIGPVVVLVGGGLDDGTENIPLGQHLAHDFSVVNYRRRGRGDSGDTHPYAVQREIDDLAAVIDAAGGRAHTFGASSGGALLLQAAAAGLPSTGSRSTRSPTSWRSR